MLNVILLCGIMLRVAKLNVIILRENYAACHSDISFLFS